MKKNNIGSDQNSSDSFLVKDFVENCNNQAFTILINRYKTKLFNQILYTVKDADLANDLYQDTCIKVLLMLRDGKYNEEGRFGGWLSRVCANVVMDYYRKNTARAMEVSMITSADDILNQLELSVPSTEYFLIQQGVRDDAVKLMNALPETQREILEMRYYQDLSFKEIAEKKGMSINTALGRMHYAVNNMRKLAAQHNVALSS